MARKGAAVAAAAAAAGIPCLHIALAASGDYGCGLWDGAYSPGAARPDAPPCNYPLTRPLALLVAAAAAEALARHLLDGARPAFELTLRDMGLAWRP